MYLKARCTNVVNVSMLAFIPEGCGLVAGSYRDGDGKVVIPFDTVITCRDMGSADKFLERNERGKSKPWLNVTGRVDLPASDDMREVPALPRQGLEPHWYPKGHPGASADGSEGDTEEIEEELSEEFIAFVGSEDRALEFAEQGFETIQSIADTTEDALRRVNGIGEATAPQMIEAAKAEVEEE